MDVVRRPLQVAAPSPSSARRRPGRPGATARGHRSEARERGGREVVEDLAGDDEVELSRRAGRPAGRRPRRAPAATAAGARPRRRRRSARRRARAAGGCAGASAAASTPRPAAEVDDRRERPGPQRGQDGLRLRALGRVRQRPPWIALGAVAGLERGGAHRRASRSAAPARARIGSRRCWRRNRRRSRAARSSTDPAAAGREPVARSASSRIARAASASAVAGAGGEPAGVLGAARVELRRRGAEPEADRLLPGAQPARGERLEVARDAGGRRAARARPRPPRRRRRPTSRPCAARRGRTTAARRGRPAGPRTREDRRAGERHAMAGRRAHPRAAEPGAVDLDRLGRRQVDPGGDGGARAVGPREDDRSLQAAGARAEGLRPVQRVAGDARRLALARDGVGAPDAGAPACRPRWRRARRRAGPAARARAGARRR